MDPREFRPTRVPPNWRRTIWPGFETEALGVIGAACIRLKGDSRRRSDWEERQYSYALKRHLEDICLEQNLSLSPRYDEIELSDQEFAAGKSPKSAPVLDICVRWHHNVPEIRFAVEAKILVTRTLRHYRPGRSVDEYVSKGMCRFIGGKDAREIKYGREMPSGAMLGYVLAGRASDLIGPINGALAQQQVPFEQALAVCLAKISNLPTYFSSHKRDGSDVFVLHHLFVEFDR